MWTSGYQIFSKQNMPPSQSVEEARAAAPRGGTAWERPPLPALRTARRRRLPLSLLVDLQRPGPAAALAPWGGRQGRRWAKSTGGGVDGWFFKILLRCWEQPCVLSTNVVRLVRYLDSTNPPKWRILSSWYWRGFTCGGDWVPSLPGQLLPRDLLKRKGRCHGRHDFKKNDVHSGWIQNQTLAHPITAPGLVQITATCRLLGLERSLLRTCWVPQWRENVKAAGFCRDCRAYVFIRKICAELQSMFRCLYVFSSFHEVFFYHQIMKLHEAPTFPAAKTLAIWGFSYQISADGVKLQILPSKSWPKMGPKMVIQICPGLKELGASCSSIWLAKLRWNWETHSGWLVNNFRPAFGLVRIDPAWRFHIQLDAFDQIAGENQHCGVSVVALAYVCFILVWYHWYRLLMARCRSNARLHCEKKVTSNPLLDIHDVSTVYICVFLWRHAVLCPPFRWWWLSSDFCLFLLTACIFHVYIIMLSYNVHDSWICPICFFSICIICFSMCIICSGCFSPFWCFQLVYSPGVPPISHGCLRSPPPSAVDRSSSVLWQVETGERYRKNGNPNQSRLSWFLVGGFIFSIMGESFPLTYIFQDVKNHQPLYKYICIYTYTYIYIHIYICTYHIYIHGFAVEIYLGSHISVNIPIVRWVYQPTCKWGALHCSNHGDDMVTLPWGFWQKVVLPALEILLTMHWVSLARNGV